ncbi:MAG: helix-turn-helix domain-containing protein [Solirubrobacterales bacterium]|nr:helix-turn-helix domain-containing protein [Solirubrobacterales bacterium]
MQLGQFFATLGDSQECMTMKTIHIDPTAGNAEQKISTIKEAIEDLLDSDKTIAVTVADEDSLLSPQQAADRLGFSRQHVRRLIEAGELEARQLPNSSHWKIPLRALLVFEESRSAAEERADQSSRSLDELGAPAE